MPLVVAAIQVVGSEDQDAGELALRASRWLQRHGVETGDLAEHLLKLVHQPERALTWSSSCSGCL